MAEEEDKMNEELYRPRAPLSVLPRKYRRTISNPNPPVLHFGIPVSFSTLQEYGARNGKVHRLQHDPDGASPGTIFLAMEHLKEECDYPLTMEIPFWAPREYDAIISLYSNHTRAKKQIIKPHEKELLEIIKEELRVPKSTKPKWYFDTKDKWTSGNAPSPAPSLLTLPVYVVVFPLLCFCEGDIQHLVSRGSPPTRRRFSQEDEVVRAGIAKEHGKVAKAPFIDVQPYLGLILPAVDGALEVAEGENGDDQE
ncbi:hypothetical protein OF83DRAFT_1088982 [Amylostereum chailletii]|nr:hypothetical protein OF83DRAFT_1088982 [Amylostereum chailletii]